MNIRSTVQGIAIGAAVTAAVMMGVPALLTTHQPLRDSEQIAHSFGVKIAWTAVTNCSVVSGSEYIGCYNVTTPNTIYVSPNLDEAHEYYIVLHEIGHVLQHRMGKGIDECGADRFAQSMGSLLGEYCPAVSDNYRLQSN